MAFLDGYPRLQGDCYTLERESPRYKSIIHMNVNEEEQGGNDARPASKGDAEIPYRKKTGRPGSSLLGRPVHLRRLRFAPQTAQAEQKSSDPPLSVTRRSQARAETSRPRDIAHFGGAIPYNGC